MAKLSTYDGREIKEVWFGNGEAAERLQPKGPQKLTFSHEYYGAHAENWAILSNDGKEISRHNMAHATSIEWMSLNG